jgi:hypothetical protein
MENITAISYISGTSPQVLACYTDGYSGGGGTSGLACIKVHDLETGIFFV